MAGTLDLFQIYYDHSQEPELYDFAKPVYSVGLTPYFENQFICSLVPQSEADYISVCSWRLRKKRNDSQHYLKNDLGLTKEKILNASFDVAILTPHSPAHQPLAMAANWHGKAWVDAFSAFKPFIGKVPGELNYAIYENHFIARKEIYHDYVRSYLIPAIDYIGNDPVYFADSHYEPKKKDDNEKRRIQQLLGRKDWPILPFLLERLFSFYINDKGFKVINL